jgi:hypothetical protein
MIRLQKSFTILLVILLILNTWTLPGTPAEPDASDQAQASRPMRPGMPDDLMGAFLTATSRPFDASAAGYHARSGGLDFTLDAGGLKASGEGVAWGLALSGFGREGQIATVSNAEIAQVDGRLEYRRGPLTEWYRNTALGVEQGFTIHKSPDGTEPLVLQLKLSKSIENPKGLSSDQAITLDADGDGISFTTLYGGTLHYDQLRAWDANGTSLDARLGYKTGQVILQVDDQAAAYPITVDPLVYLEQKVYTTDAAQDCFGVSVALSGDTALVGAYFDDVGVNEDQGSVMVFIRMGTVWIQQQKLIAEDGEAGDKFGISVALDGDTALVGAYQDDTGASFDQGSAYVFVRDGAFWTQQAKLTADDGEADDWFGTSVAVSGDIALVGAFYDGVGDNQGQGTATVFVRSGTSWAQQAKLTAEDGAAWDNFGSSVALSGDTALVGAFNDDAGGSAYVFVVSGSTWMQQDKLTTTDGVTGDYFGCSVALSGDTALVGAYSDDVGVNAEQGSASVYVRSGTDWALQAKLTATDGSAGDLFGFSVALAGDTALVGAIWDDIGLNTGQGSAYVYTRHGTTWTQQGQLTAADGAVDDWYGVSAVLAGTTALVGAFYDDVGVNADQGSAYFYDITVQNSLLYLPVVYKSMP